MSGPMRYDPATRTYTANGRPTPTRRQAMAPDPDRTFDRMFAGAGCLAVLVALFWAGVIIALIVLAYRVWG